jgi:soluble lytic murein transglycosylase-like protein
MIRSGTFAAILILSFTAVSQNANATDVAGNGYDAMISHHAAANGLPESLVRRVIMRESRYNARAVSKGNYGMMQIRLGTARAMGYQGDASGLLDPNTNLTYAVRYLAGAYRAAGGNSDRAVMNYARGYYQSAKAQGFSPYAQQPSYALAGAPAFPSEAREAYADSSAARKDRRALRQEADATPSESRLDRVEPGAY